MRWLLWYICIAKMIWVPYMWSNKKKSNLYRVQRRHTRPAWKKPLLCAKTMTHGKGWLFAMCFSFWHTANVSSLPCLKSRDTRQRVSHRQPLSPAFFLPRVAFCTWQILCSVPDKEPTAKKPFADAWLPWDLCRVLHTAKHLPCGNRALPCVFGTRQNVCVP